MDNKYKIDKPRIYFPGPPSCGKTTLARTVANILGIPYISEEARKILAEKETHPDLFESNIHERNNFQIEVFLKQLKVEKETPPPFVSDGSVNNLIFMADHGTKLNEIYESDQYKEYIEWIKDPSCLHFFVRAQKELMIQDSVRSTYDSQWSNALRYDGMLKLLLEDLKAKHGIRYMNIKTANFQERLNKVEFVIHYATILKWSI